MAADARKKIVDAAKGILLGTCSVLSVYDDKDVRVLLRSIESAKTILTEALKATSLSEDQLVTFNKKISHSLVDALQRTHKRVDEIIDKENKATLTMYIETIKQEGPMIITVSQIYLSNLAEGDKKTAKEPLDQIINRLIELLNNIHSIVTIEQMSGYNQIDVIYL